MTCDIEDILCLKLNMFLKFSTLKSNLSRRLTDFYEHIKSTIKVMLISVFITNSF